MPYSQTTIADFLSAIASEQIAPASGSAVAVTGAIGASLCEMTCLHLQRTTNEADTASDLSTDREQLTSHRNQLLQLADQDAQVIQTVFTGSNGSTSQADIKRSVGVPLAIAETCLEIVAIGMEMVELTDKPVGADVNSGIALTQAAHKAALFVASSNLEMISDPSDSAEFEKRIAQLMDDGTDVVEDFSISVEKDIDRS